MKSNNEWMSISDMMSGLMLIFMFIAISFMIQVQSDKDKMKEIAITYNKDKQELNSDLHSEFDEDLIKWKAVITRDNSIVFNSPSVLFGIGKSRIKRQFKNILNDFFPRYINILYSKKYKNEIEEIRIEGHTSKSWKNSLSQDEIYLKNMQLSQYRANHVLSYCYQINNPIINLSKKWLEQHFRANGMAFAKLKYLDKKRTIPDNIKSRRVEFKVEMKTEEKIYKILKASE
jgi:outer membrane protein OmpA-like peptidoglycan-associated protein